jgi:hypothetical protein
MHERWDAIFSGTYLVCTLVAIAVVSVYVEEVDPATKKWVGSMMLAALCYYAHRCYAGRLEKTKKELRQQLKESRR